jgi:hypothetical protein
MNRAKYFITCKDKDFTFLGFDADGVRRQILAASSGKYSKAGSPQLSLFQTA